MATTSRFRSAPLAVVGGRAHAKRPLARTDAPAVFRDMHLSRDEQIARIRERAREARDAYRRARELDATGQTSLF